MPSVDSLASLPVIPERRRRQSPDIIDIDTLDADDVVYVGSARPTQRRRAGEDGTPIPVAREVINLSDSEEDNEIEFIRHNPARPQPPLVTRHRLFSPPPPPQIGVIPPVPQIPQRFLPLRPHTPPGVIIPNEDPLPFEADLRPPRAGQPEMIAAAPSHHIPSMGFGGALLAGVRRIMGPRSTSQRVERRNSWGVSGSFIMRWDPFDFEGGQEDDVLDGFDEIGFLGDGEPPFAADRVRTQLERAFKQHDQAEPDYQSEYTHPERPLPGFTSDFSLPSSSSSPITEVVGTSPSRLASSSGTRLCEVTLVCAACQDPMVVGAADVGEDRAKRKLWGLRCGHLIDGKCIEKLMEPTSPAAEASGPSSEKVAVEQEQCSPSCSQDTEVADPNPGSMRSRLRPRRGMSGFPPHTVPTIPRGRRGAPAVTQRNNRKGKGKMRVPAVEAEHEWSCPVTGCSRVHLSLLMDGRWMMDEKRGAIAVFV